MLRLVLAAISSLQLGTRIKDAIDKSVKKAVIYAIAGVVLLYAIAFGLVAGYQALIVYGFTTGESAGIVAGALVVLPLIVLAFIPLVTREKPQQTRLVGGRHPRGHVLSEPVGGPEQLLLQGKQEPFDSRRVRWFARST